VGHPGHGSHRRGRHEYLRAPRPLDWTVQIPDIGVSAPVIRLGGPRSGAIAVPTFAQVWDVGWYRYGAVPGAQGNAVLLAHVDTYAGPAVFYNLYRLLPGEQVEVDLGVHDIQRFTVRWVKEVPKTDFPAAKVFGQTDGTHLWLITCGGAFDYQTRSYLSNIIVYTTAITHRARRPHRHHRKVSSVKSAFPAQSRPAARGGNTTGPANAATLGPDQSGTSVPGVQSGGPPPTRSAGTSEASGSRSL
jgi:sortase (surface protein transpeptidase)